MSWCLSVVVRCSAACIKTCEILLGNVGNVDTLYLSDENESANDETVRNMITMDMTGAGETTLVL